MDRSIDLKQVVELHERWLRGEDGGSRAELRRADLSRADLRYADLRRADLICADLRRADLREADLREADLSRADLREADLSRADLRRADLREADLRDAQGFYRLMPDPRGYEPYAVWRDDGWHIVAGCQDLTVPQAREHWGDSYAGARPIGDMYLMSLDWLERQPVPQPEAAAEAQS